jgi:hypothetical protein
MFVAVEHVGLPKIAVLLVSGLTLVSNYICHVNDFYGNASRSSSSHRDYRITRIGMDRVSNPFIAGQFLSVVILKYERALIYEVSNPFIAGQFLSGL